MDVLIFDMDGVLIDVSNSYRETIQRTVRVYLEACLGFKGLPKGLVTEEDISLFKSAGGFNNDWDLTSGFLLYLLSVSGIPSLPRRKSFPSVDEALSYLQKKALGSPPKKTEMLAQKNLPSFAKRIEAAGGGLRAVRRVLGVSWDGWVYRKGDLDEGNIVKRIFQEIYLGKKFKLYYHLSPLFYTGNGYYLREKPLVPRSLLAALRKRVRMGIASGRPRFEAELALKRFRLLPYFDSVVTLDESLREESRLFRLTGRRVKRSKPDPYPLLRALQEIGVSKARCGYVGDVVDDMRAAQAAKRRGRVISAIGFVIGQAQQKKQKESLLRAGADCVIERPEELLDLTA